MQLTAVLL